MASEYFRSLEFQISALTKVEPPFQQPVIPGGIIVPAVMIISFWPALQCDMIYRWDRRYPVISNPVSLVSEGFKCRSGPVMKQEFVCKVTKFP